MPNINDFFPEAECIRNGDPFFAEISKLDDVITDYRHNTWLMDVTVAEGEAVAADAERYRLSFELAALYKWLAME